jgi:hypothetical protein
MKKTNFFLLLFVLILSSCQINTPTDVGNVIGSITYFKDPKTGICFASINSNSYAAQQVVSITTVPCEKVSQFLK